MNAINPNALRNIKFQEWSPAWSVERPSFNGNVVNNDICSGYFFLPYWLLPVLKRANLTYADVLTYKKIRKVLAPIDIARLLQSQNLELKHLKSFNDYSGGYWQLFMAWANECDSDPVLYTELEEIIKPLFRDANGVAEVKQYLYAGKDSDSCYGDVPAVGDSDNKDPNTFHNVVLLNATLAAIVVEKGFLTAIEDRAYALRFVSDYLKAQYGIASISQVSYDAAFADYVRLL